MLLFLLLLFCIISRREQAPALLCRRKNFADEARRASKAKAYLAYVEPLARKQRSMRSFFKDKKRPIVLHTIGRGQTRYHLSSVQKLLHPHGKKLCLLCYGSTRWVLGLRFFPPLGSDFADPYLRTFTNRALSESRQTVTTLRPCV